MPDMYCEPPFEVPVALPALREELLVSIVMPSYNQGAYLRESLESILAQKYRPIKVLVIDGASTDNTLDILRSYELVPEVSWTSEPDSGIVEAVNKGFARAEGQIIGIQSSDDRYGSAQVIQTAVETLKANPNVGLVYGDMCKIAADGSLLFTSDFAPFSVEQFLCKRTRIPQESAFFRAELLDVVGGWREDVSYAADTDLYLRMAFKTKVVKVDEIWGVRRMHPGQRYEQSAKIVDHYNRMLDTCEAIVNGPRWLRQAARAGKHLNAFHYNPSRSEWIRTYHLYAAKLAYSRAFSLREVPWQHLFPGYLPARIALSRIKKRVMRLLGRLPGHSILQG